MVGKNGETLRIHRKNKIDGGTEYIYQLPLGFDRKKITENSHIIQDGLNTRSMTLKFNPRDLLQLKFDKTIVKQIHKILTSKKITNKEIEIEFDGMLKIKVYDEPMSEKIKWDETMLRPGEFKVAIGVNRSKIIYHDFDKTKHLIIAGVPGGGKSVVMKLIITSLILSNPDDVTFSLIDLKEGTAFSRFKDCKQMKSLATDIPEALKVLKEFKTDMQHVYKNVLVKNGYEDITEAGIKKRHFLIVDEAADLADNKEAVSILTDIVRKGRGSGHYVIYATQYPTAQVVASQIKRNIPARLTYVLDSAIASNAVLDTGGAEELPPIPGRGIYKNVKQQVIQTPLITNKEIKERIAPFITIKPRKEDTDVKTLEKPQTDRKHSLIIE